MKTSSQSHPHEIESGASSRHTRPWPPVEERREPQAGDGEHATEREPGPSSVATMVPTGSTCRPALLDGDEVFLEEAKTSDRRLASLARLETEAELAEDIVAAGRGDGAE